MPCSHLPPADLPDPLRVEDPHLTETVLALARGIAADLGFDRLPVLADALEDAGCDNFALLNHLRYESEHRVECWALRRLLRTTLMLPGDVPITFAYCPPGTFLMGSPDVEERGHSPGEPLHSVRLTRGFHVGVHPVTQAQWQAVMGTNPSNFTGETRPVECVRWNDAQEFCARTRGLTSTNVRLPTEAEWEYAARGGTTTAFHWGDEPDDRRAKFDPHPRVFHFGRYREETAEVGNYATSNPHPWGLTDAHGNVHEWCADWYDAHFYARSPEDDPECLDENVQTARVTRGGSWQVDGADCRSAARGWALADLRDTDTGFRVVFTA